MGAMIKKRVAELEGAQLDWAAAKALKLIPIPHQPMEYFYWNLRGYEESGAFTPSSEWAHGGPIIEREEIQLWPPAHPHHGMWAATSLELQVETAGIGAPKYGRTPLVAAMRAFVASKLGDKIEVPA